MLLRQTRGAKVSVETAAGMVRSFGTGVLVHQSGRNMVADLNEHQVEQLRQQLPDWIISPAGEKSPVPDARLKLRMHVG